MTDELAYLAALTLAIAFAYSATAKARDRQPTKRAIQAAGLPASGGITVVVTAAELAIAITLVLRPAIGGALALGLLTLFTLFIVYLLARRIDVSCGCFGANATNSVSEVDLVRNGVLLALSIVATGVARPTGFAIEELIAATTAVAIVALVLTAVATRRELGQFFDNRLPGER